MAVFMSTGATSCATLLAHKFSKSTKSETNVSEVEEFDFYLMSFVLLLKDLSKIMTRVRDVPDFKMTLLQIDV
jgi:hypothetical protein